MCLRFVLKQLVETSSGRSHLTSGSWTRSVCVQQSPGNAIIYTQKVITHHFIHCTDVICDPNLHTYISAVFGEYCEHHFCKLHRLCETRSLTDELFCELCEKFFIQDRLLGGNRQNRWLSGSEYYD